MIIHIVSFKLKEENKSANIEKLANGLRGLVGKIDEIIDFEVGINFTESPAAFDIVLYSSFASKEALQAYAVHPEHLKVVEIVKDVTSNRVVVDYEK